MSIRIRLQSLLVVPLLCLAPAFAQQPAVPSDASVSPIHLDVVVTPKNGGTPDAELRREDFTVLDNKVPRPITSFREVGGDEVPIEVVLVIDAVNTSYSTIAYERGEIAKFLHANGGKLAHPTTIVVVTDTGTQMQNQPTTDGNALSDSLAHFTIGLRDLRQSAGFYGAQERLQLGINALHLIIQHEATRPGRKLVLWLSPQWPLLSGPRVDLDQKQEEGLFSTVVDFTTELRTARITLYSIDPLGVQEGLGRATFYQQFLKGVSKPSQIQIGDMGLQVLSVQSGGLAVNSTGIAGLLQKCVDDTKAYYELTFDAVDSDKRDEYHQIQVKVPDSGLVARTRTIYYSHPDIPQAEAIKSPGLKPMPSTTPQ
jgi:VWFA-related protein